MSKCIICNKECNGECCSGACRAKLSRRTATKAHAHAQIRGALAERTVEAHDRFDYEIILGEKVYNRQAVKYGFGEAWELRPEPLSPKDRPKEFNRGVYTRPDGTEYQFDIAGNAHDVDIVGRAVDRGILEAWAQGQGTDYQRSLGILAMEYAQINGMDWPGSDKIMAEDTVHCQMETV